MQMPDLVSYMTHAMYLTLWLSLPTIVVAAVVGTLVSLFQALTQVQEQTLSFAIRLVAVMITMVLTARWVGGELFNFTVSILDALPLMGR